MIAGTMAVWVAVGLAQAPIDEKSAVAFLTELQRHLARDDRRAVAAMIQFPINVVVTGGFRMPFADAAALLERYDVVFTSEVKAAIARTRAGGGTNASTFALGFNPAGIRIGNGALVAEPTAAGIRITSMTISVDAIDGRAVGARKADAPASAGKPAAGARAQPERLTLQGRQRMAQRAGTLAAGETRSYTVWTGQGQTLEARLDGVRGRDALLRVMNLKTGAPIDARAGDGVRRWMGRVPAAAEYRIEVARTTAAGAAIDYTLVVSVH